MPQLDPQIFNNSEVLNRCFDPDKIKSPIIAICSSASNERSKSIRSKMHKHKCGQVSYLRSGKATLELKDKTMLLTNENYIWIPSGTYHNIFLSGESEFCSIYISHEQRSSLPNHCCTYTVTPLLSEIIKNLCLTPFYPEPYCKKNLYLQEVLIEELRQSTVNTQLPNYPTDRRLAKYIHEAHDHGILPPRMNELASICGASERTIHRLFIQETGMSYQQWRQQLRLNFAINLLYTQKSITEIAHQLEFSSSSAFILFFKKHLNITPKKYRSTLPRNHDFSSVDHSKNIPEGFIA